MQAPATNVKLSEVVGKGYTRFWNSKKRYVAIKGGRGSKKSKTAALRWIYMLMQYDKANLLVIRKTFATLRDSTYADLKWAIRQLKVEHLWDWTISPMEITYIPTGQKILFRGLDDPLKLTSITVETGFLCWAWFEEAYEITDEDAFDKVDMSIRGKLPPGYFKQILLTFNPWSEKHWLKARFFDNPDEDTLALTTTYKHNEFLGEDDLKRFEHMRRNKPKRYRIEGEGHWGISEGTIYDDWHEKEFDYRQLVKERPHMQVRFGLDFGYINDPSALIAVLVDDHAKEMYIFDEHHQQGMLNNQIAEMIKYKGYAKERITADSAEQKSIEEIRLSGIYSIRPARKGKDSVMNGIQFINQYKLFVHPKCTNTMIELSNYVWDKGKDGKATNKPIDAYNHLLDALRYAVEDLSAPAAPRARGIG
jgi:phage terminase large subunit